MSERQTESVWDYPRPPRVEPSGEHVTVELGGLTIAETRRPLRVLETSHPPVYYVPLEDVAAGALEPAGRRTYCEFKGVAVYWTAVAGGRRSPEAAWSYPEPSPGYESLWGHVAFYPAGGRLSGRRRTGPASAGRFLRRVGHLPGAGPVQGRPWHERLVRVAGAKRRAGPPVVRVAGAKRRAGPPAGEGGRG